MNPMASFRTYALAFLLCLEPSPLQARLGQSIRGRGIPKTQQRVLKELEGFGGSPDAENFPLQECQGDCDEDADCQGDLICFQRDPGMAVPGCLGGEEENSKTDFCIRPPTASPTISPTLAPSLVPISSPTAILNAATNEPTHQRTNQVAPPEKNVDTPPTEAPSPSPSEVPSSSMPSKAPTASPSSGPSTGPSTSPSDLPSDSPTISPTATPSETPSEVPSSSMPSKAPTASPSSAPSSGPSTSPSDLPSDSPTISPTATPSETPTNQPTMTSSAVPTGVPSAAPSPSLPPIVATEMTPSVAPSAFPTASESIADASLLPLRIVGNDGSFSEFPIPKCAGDCDTDVDCAEGLVCYHRRDTEAVPGCLMPEGKTFFGVDFCVDPPPPTTSPRAPEVPTVAPTDPPVETQPPKTDAPTMDVTFESTRTISPSTIVLGASASTSSPFLETVAPSEADSYAATMSVTDIPSPSPTDVVYPMLEITANNENGMKLRECAGDCDVDDDCEAGLICFQRNGRETVPNCKGEAAFAADYCIKPL